MPYFSHILRFRRLGVVDFVVVIVVVVIVVVVDIVVELLQGSGKSMLS